MDCPKCYKEINIKEETKIIKLPNILIFTLERYLGPTNNVKIIPNETLDMKKYIDSSLKVQNTEYELFAVNIRFGRNANFGHEICQVKRSKNWYEINDSDYKEIESYSHYDSSYGLFYRKIMKSINNTEEKNEKYNSEENKEKYNNLNPSKNNEINKINFTKGNEICINSNPSNSREINELNLTKNKEINNSSNLIKNNEKDNSNFTKNEEISNNSKPPKYNEINNSNLTKNKEIKSSSNFNDIKKNSNKDNMIGHNQIKSYIYTGIQIIASFKELIKALNTKDFNKESICGKLKNWINKISKNETFNPNEFSIINNDFTTGKCYSQDFIISLMMNIKNEFAHSNFTGKFKIYFKHPKYYYKYCRYRDKNYIFEDFLDIKIFLAKNKKFSELLAKTFEKKNDCNKTCFECRTQLEKEKKIISNPTILVFTLQRYNIDAEIEPDTEIDMSPYLDNSLLINKSKKYIYELFAINFRTGKKVNYGYGCEIKKDGKWYEIIDYQKKEVKGPSHFDSSFGLFYRLKNK